MSDSTRLEADAAPCDVVVGEFVFGVQRCNRDAMHTVERHGTRWRVCPAHLAGVGAP